MINEIEQLLKERAFCHAEPPSEIKKWMGPDLEASTRQRQKRIKEIDDELYGALAMLQEHGFSPR